MVSPLVTNEMSTLSRIILLRLALVMCWRISGVLFVRISHSLATRSATQTCFANRAIDDSTHIAIETVHAGVTVKSLLCVFYCDCLNLAFL